MNVVKHDAVAVKTFVGTLVWVFFFMLNEVFCSFVFLLVVSFCSFPVLQQICKQIYKLLCLKPVLQTAVF